MFTWIHKKQSQQIENKSVESPQNTRSELRNFDNRDTNKTDIFNKVQIKESEERFKSLVESSPNAIILTDNTGTIRLVNKQTENLFGYLRIELLGKKIEILLPARFHPKHVDYRDNYYKHPETRPMGIGRDLYAAHKNGSEIPVEIGLTPLKTKENQLILCTVVDITERKKYEKSLLDKNNELDRYNQELKERTAQLIQSEKMSALGILVAGVAHELNNPITGILNYAQYCRKNTPQEGKIAEVLDDLVFEAKRCAEIVKDLLSYVYVPADDKILSSQTSEITEVLKRVKNLFAHSLQNTTIQITINDGLKPFKIPFNKFQQVLSNIIKNSIDAMEDQPVKEINIKAYYESERNHIIIQDTGPGIPSNYINKIFDPFFTTKQVGKGTGLGLYVCKSIIKECNGEIFLNSEVNVGTTIHISLHSL